MRRILLALLVPLSACATAPLPPEAGPVTPAISRHDTRGGLIGLNPSELVGRLGNPALQIREGTGVKLQFRNPRCVLDAYFYPERGRELRVTHVDTRSPSGADTDQAACIAVFESAS